MTEVIQADADALDRWIEATGREDLAPKELHQLLKAFAAHRQQTVDEIVAFLEPRGPVSRKAARAIASGAYRKDGK